MNLICRENKERTGVDVVIDSPTSASSIPAVSHNLNALFVYAVLFFLMKKHGNLREKVILASIERRRRDFEGANEAICYITERTMTFARYGSQNRFLFGLERIGIENFRVISSLGRAKNESVSRFGDTRFIRESFLVYRFYYFSSLKFYDTIKFTISSILSFFLSFRLELEHKRESSRRTAIRYAVYVTEIQKSSGERKAATFRRILPSPGERLGEDRRKRSIRNEERRRFVESNPADLSHVNALLIS